MHDLPHERDLQVERDLSVTQDASGQERQVWPFQNRTPMRPPFGLYVDSPTEEDLPMGQRRALALIVEIAGPGWAHIEGHSFSYAS